MQFLPLSSDLCLLAKRVSDLWEVLPATPKQKEKIAVAQQH